MLRLLTLLVLSVLAVSAAERARGAAPAKEEVLPATPMAVREGCPNVARKLKAGQPVTVAFLGGSITENRGSFATTIPAWLRQQFPASAITAINAGWGGTGSKLGAQRIDREVLSHQPDLLFVEFAVNDMAEPDFAHMERIVRKTWTANPETDVIFLYTLSKTELDYYKKGQFPPSVCSHERTAVHYGVPMIAIGQSVAVKFLAGEFAWDDFSKDTVHPHVQGYQYYTAPIVAALPAFFEAGKPGPHALPAALAPDFVLRPPAAVAVPLAASAPLKSEDGRAAGRVYEMPRLGDQWIGAPEFAVEGRPVWRLYWQPLASPKMLDATAGLERSRWQRNVEWLDEPRFFMGPSLRRLAGGVDERVGEFGSNATEMAVVTFIAPEAGEYAVEFGAQSIGGYSQHDKQLGLNVVHFPAGANEGTSVAFFSSSRAAMKPFVQKGRVRLAVGDELALVFVPFNVGGGAYFGGVSLRCGKLE